MSSANVTITGQTGPGITNTAIVLPNVTNIRFNIGGNTIEVTYTPTGQGTSKTVFYQYSNIATVTYTISAGVATITIST